jgi:assimilatory nitrate reductase electron transfer subunit
MIVCHCKGITDSQIRRAVRQGAETVYQVGVDCCAGTGCGGCRGTIEKVIRAERRATQPVVFKFPELAPAG